ncbi:MAG: hypothetical protein GY737_17135 [Desulfobacteraceae bacterium]|nr:hypothetical protein [Desulfobacteraceae bacterium]
MSIDVEPEFDLFDSRPTRLNIIARHSEVVRPTYFTNRFPGSTTFTISPSASFFTSSKIFLKMEFKVMKKTADGTKVIKYADPDKDRIALVNNFVSSAFSSVQCTLNG